MRGVADRTRRVAGDDERDERDEPATVSPGRAVPDASGRWAVVRGSLLGDGDDSTRARVAILLEAARPPELAPLIADAYGFTERERLVTELVAQGYSTTARSPDGCTCRRTPCRTT